MSIRLNDEEWLRRQLGPDGPSGTDCVGRDVGQPLYATTDPAAESITGSAEPAETSGGIAPDPEAGGLSPRGRYRKVVVWFAGVVVVGIVISLLGVMLLYGNDTPAGQHGNGPATQPTATATVASLTPVAAEAAGADGPLPFTASANCPAGSTSAQTLAGADPTNAFVCVRDLVDGQVIQIDLSKTYVITAISITPGWIGKDSSGASQWAQHRVVTRVQYVFNDTDRTMIMQDTGNVHGEAVQPVKHVLASKITMLILQTSRPPAETTSPSSTPGLGSPGDGLFGDPSSAPIRLPSQAPFVGLGGQPTTTDPVDATFAISRLKIIGHEAI